MASDPKWSERRRLAGQARDAAIKRLKDKHPDEYNTFYREEAANRGIKPRSLSIEEKRTRLQAELDALGGSDQR